MKCAFLFRRKARQLDKRVLTRDGSGESRGRLGSEVHSPATLQWGGKVCPRQRVRDRREWSGEEGRGEEGI